MKIYLLFACLFFSMGLIAQENSLKIALLKYGGGGDWYANPTSLKNLVSYCNTTLNCNINAQIATVEVGSSEIFNYPFVHMTGHGNVIFSESDSKNLEMYLLSGGFLHIDDNYGLDTYIRREMKKVFPDKDFEELPINHPIYNQKFKFVNGLPKIHEHDKKPAQAFGIYHNNKLICLYTYESDLGDGWEDKEVHNDSNEIRQKALQMGANIIQFVFTLK